MPDTHGYVRTSLPTVYEVSGGDPETQGAAQYC